MLSLRRPQPLVGVAPLHKGTIIANSFAKKAVPVGAAQGAKGATYTEQSRLAPLLQQHRPVVLHERGSLWEQLHRDGCASPGSGWNPSYNETVRNPANTSLRPGKK